ncbi:leucine-rich repeat-containing protein 26 [Saimiri boliviensis]|uniref:leucine-rich repeat-containing protein 26 n=1 Tax=Saimiri boliviensis TaxID=27679 RepID=UPI00193D5E1B|nr:leucine-rich repeat-containing protein 26 [Saimiri boliviensis boliviensis]
MRSPSWSRPRPPTPPLLPLLLLLLLPLSPWPVWAQVSATASPSGSPGARDCPEGCTCEPGGLATCSALALPAVPAGLSLRLRELLLDHNHLRALPPGAFAGAGALQRLDLRENGLHSVHVRAFWGLGALQLLDLSANQLEALAPGTFAPLRALRTLSLAGNRLARLEPAALGALPLLRSLSLQDNALAALAPGLLARLPALDALHLHGNPWACGCALRPLCAWLRRHPLPTSEAEAAQCVWPGRLTLSPLTAFPDAAFRRCAQPLALRDLAVVYALGPASFLASVAACLALGCVLTVCSARRRRRAAALRRPRRPRDPDSDPDPHCSVSPADPGIPAAARA